MIEKVLYSSVKVFQILCYKYYIQQHINGTNSVYFSPENDVMLWAVVVTYTISSLMLSLLLKFPLKADRQIEQTSRASIKR